MVLRIIHTIASHLRLKIGLALSILGVIIFVIGVRPDFFNLAHNQTIGYIQLTVLSIGLVILSLGGCVTLLWLWKNQEISIVADFGWRLVCTGTVIAVASALADLWGFGTQPQIDYVCFGPWQEIGVLLGQLLIAIGFLMIVPWGKRKESVN